MSNFLNPVFGALEQIIDLAWVSILWLVFSIPLVTAGASTSALYYTVTKVIRHHRGYIWREFWGSFKSNFKQSTIIWILYVILMIIFWIDIRVMGTIGGTVANTLQYTFLIGMVMVTAILFFALAYTARFIQDVKHILINSALMALRHLPKTLLLLIVAALAVLSVYLMGIAFILAPAIAAILDSVILESIFVNYMSEEDREKENMRNYPEQYEYVNRKDEE
ncbi:MAG: YesL family protein [Coprococcus sp.]